MTVERGDFAKFFMAVNKGHSPFRWQERLLDTVLENGRWPDRIVAPTGSGKTSAIDVHVFATAFTAGDEIVRLPRRLAMVVDRRVLVDDQYQRARDLAEMLKDKEHDLVREVAEILRSLANPEGLTGEGAPPLVTARLRGGSVPSRSWRDYPTACAVLCCTPDMWGSRLLFNGYATSDLAASREAGLLAYDSAVLVDEAHLARQLLVTARRVSELAPVAEQPVTKVPALQVVEVTATPAQDAAAGQVTVAVEEDDLSEERLAARLTRPKQVKLLPVPEWPPGRQPGKVAAVIARAVIEMRAQIDADRLAGTEGKPEATSDTIGCYVNSVPMALAVSDVLRRGSLRVVTVCGQVRPADISRLTSRYDGVLSTRGNAEVDVVVSTQSLEVGADLDFAGIVTELASGSALAQRVGRVNRLGSRDRGRVTVIVPDGPVTDKMSSGPYSAMELREAAAWVTVRAEAERGLAPWSVREFPPPSPHPRRTLYQRPELGDAWHWARTSDDLAAEPELELWLSDFFEEETSVGIIVRDAVPGYPPDAVQFARDLPPAKWEDFPVPYQTARAVLRELLEADRTMLRIRREDIALLRARPNGDPDVRPGDQVVIDSSAKIVTRAANHGFSPPVVVALSSADAGDRVDAADRGCADDVLHYQPDLRPGSLVLRLEWSPDHEQVAGIAQATARRILDDFADGFEDRAESARRAHLARLLDDVPPDEYPDELCPLITEVKALLHKRVKDSDIILRKPDGGGVRVLVVDLRRAVADEDLRQVFTPRGKDPVHLAKHQADVSERSRKLASVLQLPSEIASALDVAGMHHDDGKADPRFQKYRLKAGDSDELLAKSGRAEGTRREVQKDQADGGLPFRWRHEQRSVVDSWAAVQAATETDPELVLRLIGTSHGRGRSGFPHNAAELAGPDDPAEWRELATTLFDLGRWDELIEATHLRYGVWGCAYLEAVLRAADGQVSGEGK